MAEGRENDPDPATFRRFLALHRRENEWIKARRIGLSSGRFGT